MVRSASYHVRVRVNGEIDPAWWSGLFSGLVVTTEPDGTTLLSGEMADQAALHGLLATIRDLGISLVSADTAAIPTHDDTRG
jgi:hypothetical protein